MTGQRWRSGRGVSRSRCSLWVWGRAGKRWRRSEGRAAYPFCHSEALYDLSNTSTLKNLGTVLWHSNVSAPSARKLFSELFFLVDKFAPEAHFCRFKILVRHGDLLVVCGPQRAVTRVLRPALPRGGSGQSCARSSARVRGCTRSVCRYYHSHESVGIEYTHFLGTHSPSLALECKCAFGAKINFQNLNFS